MFAGKSPNARFVLQFILFMIGANTLFLYWAATTSGSYDENKAMELSLVSLSNTPGSTLLQGANISSEFESSDEAAPGPARAGFATAYLRSDEDSLGLGETPPPLKDGPGLIANASGAGGAPLPLTVLLVVDYSEGHAAYADQDAVWEGLAHALTLHGTKKVTVLFAGGADVDWAAAGIAEAGKRYKGNTVSMVALRPPAIPRSASMQVALAYDVHEWILAEHQYDLVYFMDWGGLGYYAVTAKRQGLAFQDVELGVLLQGPRVWRAALGEGGSTFTDPSSLEAAHMERTAAEGADFVVSRSAALAAWLQRAAWRLPRRTFVASFPQPHQPVAMATATAPEGAVEELVFVSRQLTSAAGLLLFLDALERLLYAGVGAGKEDAHGSLAVVTLVGADVPLNGELLHRNAHDPHPCSGSRGRGGEARCISGAAYVEKRASEWRGARCLPGEPARRCIHRVPTIVVETNWEPQAVLKHLAEVPGRRVGVMAPTDDSADVYLTTLLQAKVPLVVTAVGAAPELLAEGAGRAAALVLPRPPALAAALQQAIQTGRIPVPGLAEERAVEAVGAAWAGWHAALASSFSARVEANEDVAAAHHHATKAITDQVLASVVVVHHNRARMVQHALQSLLEQDHPRDQLEAVLVDDASTAPDAMKYVQALMDPDSWFRQRGWRVLRTSGVYLGAARNAGWRAARGKYILFMDDDNVAKPHEVSTMLAAAHHTRADVVVCANDFMPPGVEVPGPGTAPEGRYLPLGPAVAAGVLHNAYGDANAMYSRRALEQLGGWPEDAFYGVQDWELHSRAALQGLRVQAVAEALYWYRTTDDSMARTAVVQANNRQLHLRPYTQALGPLGDLAQYAQHLHHSLYLLQEQLTRARMEHSGTEELYRALHRAHCVLGNGRAFRGSNLVQNGGFEEPGRGLGSGDGAMALWVPHAKGYSRADGGGYADSNTALRLELESVAEVAGARQVVYVGQQKPAPLVVQGWSRVEAINDFGNPADYSLYADILLSDGSHQWGYTLPFDASAVNTWQNVHGVLNPGKPILQIELFCMFRWRRGAVVFDDILITSLEDSVCSVEPAELDT